MEHKHKQHYYTDRDQQQRIVNGFLKATTLCKIRTTNTTTETPPMVLAQRAVFLLSNRASQPVSRFDSQCY